MPDRTISLLGLSSLFLLASYIVLVIITVSFAAWQTDLAASVRSTEADIARLETNYYRTVSTLNATSPSSLGLVKPADVHYATKVSAPALTRR